VLNSIIIFSYHSFLYRPEIEETMIKRMVNNTSR